MRHSGRIVSTLAPNVVAIALRGRLGNQLFSFAAARALRLADGPDEVHLASLGRAQLSKGKGNR